MDYIIYVALCFQSTFPSWHPVSQQIKSKLCPSTYKALFKICINTRLGNDKNHSEGVQYSLEEGYGGVMLPVFLANDS